MELERQETEDIDSPNAAHTALILETGSVAGSVIEKVLTMKETTKPRSNFGPNNMFAKRRHLAQTFLDIALLVNNVSHLVSVYVSGGPPALKRTLLGLIISSIILQIIAAFLLFHITCVYHLAENREITLLVATDDKKQEDEDEDHPSDEVDEGSRSKEDGTNITGFCSKMLFNSDLQSYETTILILDWLATVIILLVTVLNIFISAFFQLHTNLETISGDIMGQPDLFEVAVRERVEKLLKEKNLTIG